MRNTYGAGDCNPLPVEMTATCCQSGEVEKVNGWVQGLPAQASWSRQASYRAWGLGRLRSMAKKAVKKPVRLRREMVEALRGALKQYGVGE